MAAAGLSLPPGERGKKRDILRKMEESLDKKAEAVTAMINTRIRHQISFGKG